IASPTAQPAPWLWSTSAKIASIAFSSNSILNLSSPISELLLVGFRGIRSQTGCYGVEGLGGQAGFGGHRATAGFRLSRLGGFYCGDVLRDGFPCEPHMPTAPEIARGEHKQRVTQG